MPTTQTNGIDTATFERREALVIGDDATEPTHTPPVAGGQGRTADELTDTLAVCGWLMLVVVQVGAVICGIGIINAVAGPLVAAIAALCLIVVGANCYGIGRAQ